MASGFGLPTRLLDIPSTSSPSVLSTSVPVLPIPPAPSFADFRFQNIGQQPRLLTRFTDSSRVQEGAEDESMSTSSDGDQRLQNAEQNATSRSRPSLWQALAEQPAGFVTSDNLTGQVSINTLRFPIVEASASDEQQPGPAKGRFASQPDMSTFSRSFSLSHTGSRLSVPVSSTNFGGNAARQNSSDSLASMDLGYPSASPGPSGTNNPPMEDVQTSCSSVRSYLPLSSRKLEDLRQIISRFRAIPPHDHKPNLVSAILLTKSAQKKADAVHAEARTLQSSTQELLLAVQEVHTTASALVKDAEEAKGLADGAEAEIERISSAYTNRQSQSDRDEINELLESLESWIAGQEAHEAALRKRKAEQLELKKQKLDLTGASARSSLISPLSTTGPATSTTPPISISVPQKQPLFYSPTPEVDIKVDPRTWSQPLVHPSPALASTVHDPGQRQTELRRLLREKHRSSDEESQALSPLDAAREQQRRLGEERQRHLEEERRKQFEEAKIGREEENRRKEDLRRVEEERRQEEQRQEKLTLQEEERKKREEVERLREAMERKACEGSERLREEDKARESLETVRRVRVEADRKIALEEAERKAQEEGELTKKAQEEEKRRKAHEEATKRKAEEAQKKRLLLIQQQQEEELQAKLAEEAELRRTQEKAKEEQRKSEEQTLLKAEQERQEKLRQDQNMRRAQIQAEKDKTMADRAHQILAQRSHRLQSSLDGTSEMSPVVSTLLTVANAPLASPLVLQGSSTQQPPLVQGLPQEVHANGSMISKQTGAASNGQTPTPASQGNTSDPRSFSLPPVTYLSQSDRSSSATSAIPPSQRTPTLSVYSLSSDSGNVPYRENSLHLSPPQAQAANIRHVVSALNLQSVTLVKTEPVPDDSKLLYPPSRDQTPAQPQTTQPIQKPILQHSQIHPPVPQLQQSAAPLFASASQPSRSLPAEPMNGSHTHTILNCCIPSSPAITEILRSCPSQSQQLKQPQQVSAVVDPMLDQLRTQVPSRPVSAASARPQPRPNHRPVSRNEVQQEPIPLSASHINGRSRSSSPFRMGPDTYVAPQPTTDSSPSDISSDSRALPTVPASFRGRLPPSTSIPPSHWDHYSPSPQRPRSPPSRQTDTYRPNYSERARSPVQVGRKRSRENSPGPYVRDYRDRDFDDRRAPHLGRSRTPPRRAQSRRTTSRSPSRSPGYATHRPSLATRLGQGPPPSSDNTYRPITPPKDWERDREPNLLSRFSDARTTGPLAPKPGRPRGKRGRGGGGGVGGLPSGISHTSLGERISSGSTLAKRIQEDPRRS